MKVKEAFFDRFDQTFKLFKNNFFVLILPIFLYNMVSVIIFDIILSTYFTTKLASMDNIENFNIGLFLSDPTIVLLLNVWLFLFLIYLLLYVVIFLWTLKTIKNITEWKNVYLLENIKYWVLNFLPSMKTYWYVFSYVYLTPSLIFISGWIMYSVWLYIVNEFISNFWIWLMMVSFFILLYYVIYRWNKSTFALYSAVEEDQFTDKNFNKSVLITDNKFLRLFWNLFLIWFIIWAWVSMINWIIWMILFSAWWWADLVFKWVEEIYNWGTLEDAKLFINSYIENSSIFSDIIWNTLTTLIKNIWIIFVMIFIYLFYLRLYREYEYENWNSDISNNENDIKL